VNGWVICPRCLDAWQGSEGVLCSICGTAAVDTPLFKNVTKKISSWITLVWGD
jgi:hypothetical protein